MKRFITLTLMAWVGLAPALSQIDNENAKTDSGAIDLSGIAIDDTTAASDNIYHPMDATSTQHDDEVVGYSSDMRFEQNVPLANRHTVNNSVRFHSRSYSKFFLELEGLYGFDDVALGANFSYVPRRWGCYGSFLVGSWSYWGSAGAVLRPVIEPSELDWQLYAGPAFGFDCIGLEVGTRLALGRDAGSDFSWLSGSVGMIRLIDGSRYYTIGLSLEISTFLFWFIL